jgi:hypothetical protein
MLKYIPSTPNFFRAYSMKGMLHVVKEFSAFRVLMMWVFSTASSTPEQFSLLSSPL